jgi:hypothetical protein
MKILFKLKRTKIDKNSEIKLIEGGTPALLIKVKVKNKVNKIDKFIKLLK